MILLPAIDIKDKLCVRLTQGDFNKQVVYSDQPTNILDKWIKKGAKYLHIVDLNGASGDNFINKEMIKEMVSIQGVKIQVGGGIRSLESAKRLLDLGVDKVIVGTIAVNNKALLREMIDLYKDKIIVSIDAKDGKVATNGWLNVSCVNAIEFVKELESIGVNTIVYTDISKDGMLEGPNYDVYKTLCKTTRINVIASGGIHSILDLIKLKEMGVYGVIIGKALYENKIDLEEALKCLQEGSSRV